MGLILRSYRINSALGAPDGVGLMPGNILDKATAFFGHTEARRRLDALDIPWRVHAAVTSYDNIPPEAIFAMTCEQYALWRIADGERFSTLNEHTGVLPGRLKEGTIEAKVKEVLEPLGWEMAFFDGTLNFSKGDAMFSVYDDGKLRGVHWCDYIDFYHFVAQGHTDVMRALRSFPFFNIANCDPASLDDGAKETA